MEVEEVEVLALLMLAVKVAMMVVVVKVVVVSLSSCCSFINGESHGGSRFSRPDLRWSLFSHNGHRNVKRS